MPGTAAASVETTAAPRVRSSSAQNGCGPVPTVAQILRGALYGLLVEHGDPNLRTEFNTVAIEKLRNFDALDAHIYCGPLSENNTFLVENLDDVTVVDDGVDNVFEDLD